MRDEQLKAAKIKVMSLEGQLRYNNDSHNV